LTQSALERVLWLGGMSGVGKTTAARLFAHRHDLRLYSLDARTYEHASRLPPETRTLDEIWVEMTPTDLSDWFEEKARERFPLVVEDLLAIRDEAPIVVEGPQLLPELVAPLLASLERVLYVVAPPQIQQPLVSARGSDLAVRTGSPERARANRLARDEELARRLRVNAEAHGLPLVEVADVTDTLPAVERHFGPSVAAWIAEPHGDVAARRRDENDARLRQWRAHVDAMAIEASGEIDLACECEAPGCEVPVTIGLLDAEAARARDEPLLGH
jgi:dephospho-CoA kinase